MSTLRGPGQERSRLLAIACCVAMLAAGCTTMQPLDRQSAARDIEAGDTIVVTTRDGRELELVFADWSSEALTGSDELGILQKVENEDIERVEVEKLSVLRNVGLGLVVVGMVAAAAADSIDY